MVIPPPKRSRRCAASPRTAPTGMAQWSSTKVVTPSSSSVPTRMVFLLHGEDSFRTRLRLGELSAALLSGQSGAPTDLSTLAERSVGAPDWPESSAAESSPSRRRVRKESSPWRRKTIRVGTDDELGVTTLVELHCAIPVGAVRGDAAQRRERFGGGMTIPVLSADGDHGRARTDRIDKWDRVRAGGAVVRRYVHAC